MRIIEGNEIEATYVEWGVEYETSEGIVIGEADDETEARFIAGIMDGRLLARTVYETAWAEVAK